MTTVYIGWNSILPGFNTPYNKHSYLVVDPNDNLNDTGDQKIIRGGDQNLTFTEMVVNLLNGTYVAGDLDIEAGEQSQFSVDGLNNIGDDDGDGFLNNDKDKDGVADTTTDRNYTVVDLAPALAKPEYSTVDDVWNAMEAFAADLDSSDFGYKLLSHNCQAVTVSALAAVGVDFQDNVPSGSIYSQWVSRNVILNGDGDFEQWGFDGHDRFYDTGGNDVFHGGDGSITQALNYADGTDRIHYVGQGDVTYRYVKLTGGESAWNAIQVDGSNVSTDTLYSVEEFRGASFPFFNNTIDLSGFDEGVDFEDVEEDDFDPYMDDVDDLISSVTTTELGTGNTVSLIDMNTFIGTDFDDTFTLNQNISRSIDGGGGVDDIYLTENLTLASGNGISVKNIENIDVASFKSGYFIIEEMGNNFTSETNYITWYTTLSYKDYSSAMHFDFLNGTVSDSVGNTDTFNSMVSIIGTNFGDTYTFNEAYSDQVANPIPIFTGSGDDIFIYDGIRHAGPVFYNGGNDVVESTARIIFTLPLDVELSDVSQEVINVHVESETSSWRNYFGDVMLTIDGYGSILYKDKINYSYAKNLDVYVGRASTTGVYAKLITETGQTTLSTQGTPPGDSPLPPVYFLDADHFLGENISTIINKDAYHGSLGNDVFSLVDYTGWDNFYAYDGDDTIIGGVANNIVYGGSGDDVFTLSGVFSDYSVIELSSYTLVQGAVNTDTVYDVETLQFSDGFYKDGVFTQNIYNIISGTSGDDNPLTGTSGPDQILGLAGNDTIYGNDGDDDLQGGTGADYIDAGNGDDLITGGNGNDTLIGRSGNDEIHGGAGDDTVDGKDGDDTLYGDEGVDILKGETGNDQLYGGAGMDDLRGHGGDDELHGGDDNDLLTGFDGLDKLYGDGGDDELHGGTGQDELYGGDGNDLIRGNEDNDLIFGGLGDDELYGGTLSDETFVSDDEVHGDAGNDLIYGSRGNDLLFGDAGTDTIYGGYDDDTIHGGDDNDFLRGDRGNDEIHGGAGVDDIGGNRGNDTIYGDDGDDTIAGSEGFDILYGGNGNDILKGETDNDELHGGAGDDDIRGHQGHDILYGDAGNDTLTGYTENDTLNGGLGADILYGQDGWDNFVFDDDAFDGNIDTVKDFDLANFEVIKLTDVLEGYTPGTSAIADFVTFTQAGAHTELHVDRDGTGTTYASQQIALVEGVTGLDAQTLLNGGNLVVETTV